MDKKREKLKNELFSLKVELRRNFLRQDLLCSKVGYFLTSISPGEIL